jgi:hypothetical protein
MATEFGPWAGGAGIGLANALYTGSKFNAEDKAQKEAASRLSSAKDISSDAKKTGLKRMDDRRMSRAGKQFLGPAGWLGAGAFTSEVVAPRFKDDPETQKYINLAATTENAAGTGMLAKQLIDLATRKDPIDPVDRARIGSSGGPGPTSPGAAPLAGSRTPPPASLPPPDAPTPPPDAGPQPKPLNPGTAAYMRQQLKEFGVKGTSSMNKSALADALAKQMAEHGAKRTVGKKITKGAGKAAIPLAVGSYMAATGDSEADDATTAERAGNAATNFGVGAGAAYGGSKLVDALSKIAPMAMKAGGMGLSLLNPAMMTDMTDGLAEIPPEAIQAHDNAIFNRNARWLPEWMMTQNDMNAKEMAQVPTPSPERRSEGPRVAAAPEGPFGPRINQRIARMTSGGATPEQIAHFLNQAVGQ